MDAYRTRLEKGLDEEEEPFLYREPPSEADEPCRCHGHSENQNDRRRRFFGRRWGPRMHGERGCKRRRRVGHFIFAGILLYFLARFVVFGGSRFADTIKRRRDDWYAHSQPFFGAQNEMLNLNPEEELPDNLEIGDCATWTEPSPHPDSHPPHRGPHHHHHRFSSNATLSLPLDSAKLFILSRGPSAGGLHIIQSDEAGDEVKITTTVEFDRMKQLDGAKVCLVDGDEGENGVGIFTRHGRRRHHKHGLAYRVLVDLPRASDGGILKIPNFSTDTPLFAQFIDDISKTVSFDTLALQSGFLPIHAKGISAQTANVGSGFSPIEGNFVVDKSLIISTTNSPININATLNNGNGDETTKLILDTTNAHITADIHLISTAESGTGGSYDVVAHGSISPINLKFPTAPLDSALKLSAHTTLSPVDISLHPTYEGSFSLATSFAETKVIVNINDPAEKERTRDVQYNKVGGVTSGFAQWDEGGKDRGSVDVSTSFAPVRFTL